MGDTPKGKFRSEIVRSGILRGWELSRGEFVGSEFSSGNSPVGNHFQTVHIYKYKPQGIRRSSYELFINNS